VNNEKSNEEIARAINKKIALILLSELPLPSCPIKKQRIEWRRGEVIKKVINLLHDSTGTTAI
jgi:hypothetical protein